MALTRSSPLLTTTAEVVKLTAHLNLAEVESGGEFDTATTLLAAHEWVYDRLAERLGVAALAVLTNQTSLERAVAYYFVSLLYGGGHVGSEATRLETAERWERKAFTEVNSFRATFSDDSDESREAGEGQIRVGNFGGPGWEYAGRRQGGLRSDRIHEWYPDVTT